jgi:hypothetical protein
MDANKPATAVLTRFITPPAPQTGAVFRSHFRQQSGLKRLPGTVVNRA